MSAVASNVVALPGAASRKVKQHENPAAWAARLQVPRLAGEYIHPATRQIMVLAEMLHDVEPSPAIELALQLVEVLGHDVGKRLAAKLAEEALTGRRTALQAFALHRTSRMTVGEQMDLDSALRRLEDR